MTRELIKTENLTKIYSGNGSGEVTAVKDVDVTIEKGEFVSVIGPSGCGKTTFLRMLSGLLDSSSGYIFVKEQQINGPVSDVGFVFQSPLLLDWRTVKENVLLPYEAIDNSRGMSEDREYYEERAEELLETVGLGEFTSNYPDELSGGMQQRVAICRALLPDPSILLMDEPFGALDEFTRENLNKELANIHDETEKTIVFVTHNISEAVFLSDRVVVFSTQPGEIVADIEIDISRPRELDIRDTEKFINYTSTIRDKITTE